jgi:hypothetical protein
MGRNFHRSVLGVMHYSNETDQDRPTMEKERSHRRKKTTDHNAYSLFTLQSIDESNRVFSLAREQASMFKEEEVQQPNSISMEEVDITEHLYGPWESGVNK